MEVIAITDKIQRKAGRSEGRSDGAGVSYAKSSYSIGSAHAAPPAQVQRELQFNVGEIERALYAKIVKKCGNRHHWEDWANDIAKIAQTHIMRCLLYTSSCATGSSAHAPAHIAAQRPARVLAHNSRLS